MRNQQLPTKDQQRNLRIIITKDLKWQKQTEKSYKTAISILGVHCRQIQVRKQRTDSLIIQIVLIPQTTPCGLGIRIQPTFALVRVVKGD